MTNFWKWAGIVGVVLFLVAGFFYAQPAPAPIISDSTGTEPSLQHTSTTATDTPSAAAPSAPPTRPDLTPATVSPAPHGLSGFVVDHTYTPLANATVSAYDAERGATRVTTGTDGAFVFDALAQGNYRLSASKDGYNEAVLETVPWNASGQRLVMTPLSAVHGNVIRARDGAPLTAFQLAYVDIPPADQAHWRTLMHDARVVWNSVEDPHGAFSLSDIASDQKFALAARADGLEPAFVVIPPIPPGEISTDHTISLPELTRIEGIVVSDGDFPVQGARIFVDEDKHDATLTLSDNEGRFVLQELGEGPMTVFANHPQYSEASAVVSPEPDTTVTVRLVMSQGAALEGLVTEDGRPLAGVPVSVQTIGGGRSLSKTVESENDGAYAFSGLPAGLALVEARAGGSAPDADARHLRHEVELAVNFITEADFAFTAERAQLSGRVTLDGAAVAGATVVVVVDSPHGVHESRARTNADGLYTVVDLAPGPYTATLAAPMEDNAPYARQTAHGELVAGTITQQDFSLDSSSFGSVSGIVSNMGEYEAGQVLVVAQDLPIPRSGDDVAGFLALERQSIQQGPIAEDGTFVLEAIPPGTYTLVAVAFSTEDGVNPLDSVRTASATVAIDAQHEEALTLTLH